jgi:putative transposase
MKASRFTDAQKAFIIKQGEDGMPVAEVCRKAGISQATYFNWKKKYAGLMPSEMKRLRDLEQENARLRKSLLICRWTRKCSRTSSNESSEGWPEENAGRRDPRGLERVYPEGLRAAPVQSDNLPLQVSLARPARLGTAD